MSRQGYLVATFDPGSRLQKTSGESIKRSESLALSSPPRQRSRLGHNVLGDTNASPRGLCTSQPILYPLLHCHKMKGNGNAEDTSSCLALSNCIVVNIYQDDKEPALQRNFEPRVTNEHA